VIRVDDVARIIEEHFSPDYALPGDSIGLQAGDPRQAVRGILVALDPSPEALGRARTLKADLVVTHHPLLYESVRGIDTSTLTGAALRDALGAGIAVYSAHTNLDTAPRGLARELARRIGLTETEAFPVSFTERWQKVVVFVPEKQAAQVHRAMAGAGAGSIGNYDMCAFASRGEGMFRPLGGSRPTVGSQGKLEKVKEVRLEMIVDSSLSAGVVAAMKAAHPYEEPAYDLYPLRLPEVAGIGCVGRIGAVRAKQLARRLAASFRAEARLSGRPPSRIERVAVVPGSGGSYLREAHSRGAELLVTGEARYHQMLEAEHLGVGIIELGHDRSEMPAVDLLAGVIRAGLPGRQKKIKVHTYRRPRAAAFLAAKT
jgi:dinuclear metal center YbgI/SA1388 family protein